MPNKFRKSKNNTRKLIKYKKIIKILAIKLLKILEIKLLKILAKKVKGNKVLIKKILKKLNKRIMLQGVRRMKIAGNFTRK
jgi:hypothetical protein